MDPTAAAFNIGRKSAGSPDFTDSLSVRPQRGFIRNLDNGRRQQFLFNPQQFDETYEAVYARKGAPGLSHERLQYLGNKNAKIPLDLIYDEYFLRQGFLDHSSVGGLSRRLVQDTNTSTRVSANTGVDAVKRFFLEAIYPRRSQRLITASPPALLFIWPGEISMRVRITKLRFRHKMFEVGTSFTRVMVVSVTLEEDVQERIFSDAVFVYGTQRPWATSDRPRRKGS